MVSTRFSFSDRFASDPQKPWLRAGRDKSVSFEDLAARASAIRRSLADAPDRGKPVAVHCSDPVEIVASILACWADRRTAAILDPATPPDRWRAIREVLGFEVRIGGGGNESPEPVCRVSPDGTDFSGARDLALALDAAEWALPALILFSSGTTGTPKCIPLSVENLLANIAAMNARLAVGASDTFLCTSPCFYAHGLYNSLLTGFFTGSTVLAPGVLNPMNAAAALAFAEEGNATVYHATPTMVKIFNLVAARSKSLPRFRHVICGTARIEPGDRQRFQAIFGIPVLQQYGMSESLIMTLDDKPDPANPESVGTPVGCDLFLLDEDGNPSASGGEGEVAVRSPSAFGSYFNQPEETASAYRGDLFFTGDLGRLDGRGALVITGRKKELIKRGGVNISPLEIERALLRIEGIDEVAVVGYPDPAYGEEIAAFVVGKALPGEDGIRDMLAGVLPRTHLPRKLIAVPALPKTASGKPAKAQLQKLAFAAP
jgi:long-chain acyl-CoA synthetase